jgi:hypothetical protein
MAFWTLKSHPLPIGGGSPLASGVVQESVVEPMLHDPVDAGEADFELLGGVFGGFVIVIYGLDDAFS